MPGTMPSRGNIVESFLIAASITPVALSASTAAEQTFTIKGLKSGDQVSVTSNAAQTAGVVIGYARVSAADTLAICFGNCTAGTPTPVAGLYSIEVNRPEVGGGTLPTTAA